MPYFIMKHLLFLIAFPFLFFGCTNDSEESKFGLISMKLNVKQIDARVTSAVLTFYGELFLYKKKLTIIAENASNEFEIRIIDSNLDEKFNDDLYDVDGEGNLGLFYVGVKSGGETSWEHLPSLVSINKTAQNVDLNLISGTFEAVVVLLNDTSDKFIISNGTFENIKYSTTTLSSNKKAI